MAEQTYYTHLTTFGSGTLSAAITGGSSITLTHLALGDGGGALYDPDGTETDLVNETHRIAISSINPDPQNPAWLIVEAIIPPDVGGWWIREAGIFDADGNLFSITKYPETYKAVLTDGTASTLTIQIILQVTNTDSIQLVVNPLDGYASRAWVLSAFEWAEDAEALDANVEEKLIDPKRLHFAIGGKANADHDHDDDYYSRTAADEKFATQQAMTDGLNTKAPTHDHPYAAVNHSHDDTYSKDQSAAIFATKTALTNGLATKSNQDHTHDFSVLSDETLEGDGTAAAPLSVNLPPRPYPHKAVFSFTGSDQVWTVPDDIKWMRIHCVGASGYRAGGWSWIEFNAGSGAGGPIGAGVDVSVVVGERVFYSPSGPMAGGYGFGGDTLGGGANEAYTGAGLSGVFTGADPVAEHDAARALVIAGGAGGYCDNDHPPITYSTPGNDPDGGGMSTMRGTNGDGNADGGGGGGYTGGVSTGPTSGSNGGRGGSGYVLAGVYASGIEVQNPIDVSGLPPPGSSEDFYEGTAGKGGSPFTGDNNHGLVVIEYSLVTD